MSLIIDYLCVGNFAILSNSKEIVKSNVADLVMSYDVAWRHGQRKWDIL